MKPQDRENTHVILNYHTIILIKGGGSKSGVPEKSGILIDG